MGEISTMKRLNLGLRVPVGTEDVLPAEQNFIRLLEKKTLDLFAAWAYDEVSTPAFEYLAVINPDVEKADSLYKFSDRDGSILALRPELTIPIARMASTRLKGNSLPLRLCYCTEVFRYEKPPARREFRQAGVELLGSANPVADAEVIALAVDTLRSAGVTDFQINLGHIELFRGLVSDLGATPEICAVIEDCLARKDFVALEIALAKTGLNAGQRELILGIPALHGGEDVLARIRELAKSERTFAALDNLTKVYKALQLFGVHEDVAIDLGVLRGFDYYTGVVFEGYAAGLGFPLCEGGRYDGLLANFGLEAPATGFAVNLERLVSIIGIPPYHGAEVFVAGSEMQAVIEKAKELRAQGMRVELGLNVMSEAQARDYAAAKGIDKVIMA